MPDPSPDTPSVCPTAPDGYVACRTTHGPGASSTVQVTHLVRLDDSGSNGGRPTMCGLTRFDKRSPDGWDVIELAAIPGWSMGGGGISGPGITQKACQSCWSAATPTAPGSSSPDTAALVAELRGGIAECGYRDADDPCPACVSDARCADALEAQDSRITELEAHNRRLATTMTGDTAVDLRVLYAYELGIADGRLPTPTEETTE